MRIIGVIDLLGGRAVHAKGGCRDAYRPLDAAADVPVNGDPAVLAGVYCGTLGLEELYVADLDAIAGGDEQEAAVRAIVSPVDCAQGRPPTVWLDAGTTTTAQARRALARGASHVVVGLETLTSFDAVRDIAGGIGSNSVAFSLDLREGQALAAIPHMSRMAPQAIAQHAVAAGATSVIVLDLARVGSGRGLDLLLIERVRREVPGTTLLAGGGVRDAEDLRRLASAGCDGALVATALHRPGATALLRAVAGQADLQVGLDRGHG